MLDPREPLRLNRAALMKGEAKYYFGLPVTSGQVKWQVNRDPVFPGGGPIAGGVATVSAINLRR